MIHRGFRSKKLQDFTHFGLKSVFYSIKNNNNNVQHIQKIMPKKVDDLDSDLLELNEKANKPKVRLKSINNREDFLENLKNSAKHKMSLDSTNLKSKPISEASKPTTVSDTNKLNAPTIPESNQESQTIIYRENTDSVSSMSKIPNQWSKLNTRLKQLPEQKPSKTKRNVSVFTNAVQPKGISLNTDSGTNILRDPQRQNKRSTSGPSIAQPRNTLARERITLEQYIEKLRAIGDSEMLHNQWIEDVLWEKFKTEESGVDLRGFLGAIRKAGIDTKKDPRLKALQQNIDYVEHFLMSHMNDHHDEDEEENVNIVDLYLFKGMIAENIELIYKVFTDGLVIPDFRDFTNQIKALYREIKINTDPKEGHLASYIPQLGRADPNWFGISVCTIDGQRWSTGDTSVPYTVQSTCKPINYALDITEYGADKVHEYIGKEPSGCKFNSIALDPRNKPHNPMINSGAIMACALYHPELDAADRFEKMHQQYRRLAGGEHCGFNNSVFL